MKAVKDTDIDFSDIPEADAEFWAAVYKGIAAADRGEFASPADIERIQNKYRA